jgi:hypothetical protein
MPDKWVVSWERTRRNFICPAAIALILIQLNKCTPRIKSAIKSAEPESPTPLLPPVALLQSGYYYFNAHSSRPV